MGRVRADARARAAQAGGEGRSGTHKLCVPSPAHSSVFAELRRCAWVVRFQTYAPGFAAQLYAVLAPYLTDTAFATPTPAKGLYPKIRIYDYPPQTFFGPHYDESTDDSRTGLVSHWTLLVYLTGAPDVEGGETVFWTREPNARGRNGESLDVDLRAGRAVLHRHGAGCLLHEGKEVVRGHKWILRSDVMYSE